VAAPSIFNRRQQQDYTGTLNAAGEVCGKTNAETFAIGRAH
jgi:hypothetical protein